MNVKLIRKVNQYLADNEINVTIEYSKEPAEMDKLIQYINNYKPDYLRKIVVSKDYELLEIDTKDIIVFYSNNKNNFCKTKDNEYKIKSKLYEIEKMDLNFVRISKNCVVNLLHIESFNIGKIGKIVIKLDNNTEEIVSRRKVKDVMNYLNERSV